MTKSGIGTHQSSNMSSAHSGNSTPTPNQQQNQPQQQTMSQPSSSTLIANAEIPVWVSDKKKWVTGISKKTTINDLIFAILKQCQIAPQKNTQNENDTLSSLYVLVEYNFEPNSETGANNTEHQVVITSQRILNGDSKVYKYLSKWSFSGQQPHQHNNLMLKILQRQPYENSNNSDQNTQLNDQQTTTQSTPNSFNNSNELNARTNSTSLATKLLKKFGVSSSSSSSTHNNTVQGSQVTKSTSSNLPASVHQATYRYVDVKLPAISSSQSHPNHLGNNSQNNGNVNNKSFNLSPASTNSTGSLNKQQTKNFDPNVQKSFVTGSIMEKDNKLKQQIKRFQLIDELIKETEKKSKSVTSTSALFDSNHENSTVSTGFLTNPTYNYSPLSAQNAVDITNLCKNVSDSGKALNVIDLNDVYCHFPEMSTHHLKEVEDFTVMCSQLFQLEEAIRNQKQILTTLEVDLQRELQPNQVNFLVDNTGVYQQDNSSETPETEELRKEVNYSREQTRLQCKQLHDLDMRMKQNEQNLMDKEQEVQQLLEELYIQEIYADNVLETAITNTNTISNTTPNRPVTPSGSNNNNNNSSLNMSTFKLNNSNNSPNNFMVSGNKGNLINMQEQQQQQQIDGQNETIESFENENNCTHDREKMVELIINERNSFNNSNIDFIQLQQQKRIAMENTLDLQTRRVIRMFNESNDDIFNIPNDQLDSKQKNSIKIVNQNHSQQQQQHNGQLQSQHKSLSYGNLAANQRSNSTHNIHQITSPVNQQNVSTISKSHQAHQKAVNLNNSLNVKPNMYHHDNNENPNHMKKLQNNQFLSSNAVPNGDHSGGDNDSGISSMSSETAAAITSALNSNLLNNNSFNYSQKPLIIGGQIGQHAQQRCLVQNAQQQQSHQMFSNNQPYPQHNQFSHRQIYQNAPNNNNNISMSQANPNTSTSSVSKAVLETLV